MASFFTDKGMRHLLGLVFNNEAEPTNYYAYLINSTGSITESLNTWSEVSAQKSTNYATNPLTLNRDSTDFPSITEGSGEATVGIKTMTYTASGGNMTGDWVIITDDNGTEASRIIIACLDLGGDQTVTTGQTLSVQSTVLKIS